MLTALALRPSPFVHYPSSFYLEKYYSYVGSENAAMFRAIARTALEWGRDRCHLIELGGGPSLASTMALVAAMKRPVRAISWVDVSRENLDAVQAWLRKAPDAFDYEPILEWLAAEHRCHPSQIAAWVRASGWTFVEADLRNPLPSDLYMAGDIVSSHFFAESATSDEEEFVLFLRRVAESGRPDAMALLSFMRHSVGYSLVDKAYPATPVDEVSIEPLLARAGFGTAALRYDVEPAETPPTRAGYDGMLFVTGTLEPSSPTLQRAANVRPGSWGRRLLARAGILRGERAA